MNEAEPLTFLGDNEVRAHGRRLLYFSGCDYFRLARRPQLTAAAAASLKAHGLNVAASRVTTGNHEIYRRLERELARFFGTETAVLLPDGYLAPLAVAQALAGEFTHALLDEFAHGALVDAAHMLGCPVQTFGHRNVDQLKAHLSAAGPRARPIILTDGMFAHDGSVAPLRQYLACLPGAGKILVDDAHGAGVLGARGRGTLEAEQVPAERMLQCATLSKAFGAFGGVVPGSWALREKILGRSRVFVGTTPLPPPLAGAGLSAVKLVRAGQALREKLFANLRHVRAGLRSAGWEIAETAGPIIRLPPMEEPAVATLKKKFLAAGIFPPFLKYPGGSARGHFRCVISSGHQRDQLDLLIAVLAAWRAQVGPGPAAVARKARAGKGD